MSAVYLEREPLRCCGVHEIDGISAGSASDIVDEVCRMFHHPYGYHPTVFPAFLLFSEAGKRGGNYGRTLARYIHANQLGLVTRTDRRKNPNTGNLVRVYLWAVAHGRMAKRKKRVESRYAKQLEEE